MKKVLVTLSILVSIVSGLAFAETYPKVTYSGGHPELQTDNLKGELNVLSDRVEFTTPGGQGGIKIPYETVQKVSLVHIVGGRPYLKTTAWVTGIVLAPLTFGGSLIPAIGMTGLKKNGYYVSVEYKDDVDLAHAVNFQVKGSDQQLKMKADIENYVYKYRKTLKDAKEKEAASASVVVEGQDAAIKAAQPEADDANTTTSSVTAITKEAVK